MKTGMKAHRVNPNKRPCSNKCTLILVRKWCYIYSGCGRSLKKESTFKDENFLLEEQLLTFESWPHVRRETNKTVASS